MKFRCERDVLLEALATTSRATAGRAPGQAALSGVRLEVVGDRLALVGTDLELTIAQELDVDGDDDGVVVVPARLALEIVRAFEPGAVTVELLGDDVHLSSGRSQFAVHTLPADDFPRVVDADGPPLPMDTTVLSEALRQVVSAASPDPQRGVLTGVLLSSDPDGLRVVATDSYRLALRTLPTPVLEEGEQVVVPSRALAELARLLDSGGSVILRLGERDATFTTDSARLTTRLIEGTFPPHEKLIPSPSSYPNRLEVGRQRLIEAVRRVRLLARDGTPIRLHQRAESLKLYAVDPAVGEASEEIDASYQGTELTVAFNPEFLLDGADAVVGDELVLDTLDASKPAVLRSLEQDEFLYLLMPIRVS